MPDQTNTNPGDATAPGGDTTTPTTPGTTTPGTTTPGAAPAAIAIDSPLYQVAGGQLYKINVETTAAQVKTGDGLNVETRINTLERALANNAQTHVVADIPARDALLSLITGDICQVLDASADPTVDAGAATYIYMQDGNWKKIAEAESMDIIFNWALLQDKPSSTVAQIDLAVAKQHTHDNIETLTHISDDGAGNLLFKGKRINDGKAWVSVVESLDDLPGNMAENALVFVRPGAAAGGDTGGETGGDAQP